MITTTPISLRDFAPNVLGQAVAEALEAQATLTAVDKFSSWHQQSGHATPELEKWYRELLPLHAPGPGEQFAFEVDLDRCSGCKACVTACHSLNGLDDEEGESFRDVGLLLDPGHGRGPQHITSACHHCLQPGCADGCPVLAYEKEPDTGVVRHLDDQCIGCEYCVLKCPYDVPKYHHGKGIVRKCDLCVGRLRAGEAPACVQACPTKAIRVTVVSTALAVVAPPQAAATSQVATNSSTAAPHFDIGFTLPGAPDPVFTRPTTRYKSSKPLPTTMLPGDAHSLRTEAGHEPLAATLVITQLAFGLCFAQWLYRYVLAPESWRETLVYAWPLALLPFVVMNAGLIVGLGHLGRPQLAWKAWLNWRKSWLSREVIAFAVFAGAAGTGAMVAMAAGLGFIPQLASLAPLVDASAVVIALAALCANAMVYIDTPRAAWRTPLTLARFALTSLSTGAIGITAALAVLPMPGPMPVQAMSLLLALGALAHLGKLGTETWILRHRKVTPADSTSYQLSRSAALLLGPKRNVFLVRMALGLAAPALALVLALIGGPWLASEPALPVQQTLFALFAMYFAADCLERHLFFSASASPRMPGAL